MTILASVALAIVLAASIAPATAPGHVPEPDGLYEGPMHGYTPSTLAGGKVLVPADLAALIEKSRPVLLDVSEADRKPPGMPAEQPWSPRHHSIPGSVWLPGAGRGALPALSQGAFEQRVAALMGNDRDRPIVTFCHPDCWGSWNAAKRLVMLGYRHVHWLPSGIDGWQEDHPTQVVKPDPEWTSRPGGNAGL